jgi:hypothetical protein
MIILNTAIESVFYQFGVQVFGSFELFGLVLLIGVVMLLLLLNMPPIFVFSGGAMVLIGILAWSGIFRSIFALFLVIVGVLISMLFWNLFKTGA